MKRPHDLGNYYKGKHLLGACSQVQRFSSLSGWEAWCHTGRHEAGEVAEICIIGSAGSKKREIASGPGLDFWNLQTHLQWPTKKATPTQTRPYILIVPLRWACGHYSYSIQHVLLLTTIGYGHMVMQKCNQSNSKSSHILQVSTLIKNPKFKFSSETQDNI